MGRFILRLVFGYIQPAAVGCSWLLSWFHRVTPCFLMLLRAFLPCLKRGLQQCCYMGVFQVSFVFFHSEFPYMIGLRNELFQRAMSVGQTAFTMQTACERSVHPPRRVSCTVKVIYICTRI